MKSNVKYMLLNWLKWDSKSLIFFFLRVPALVFMPIVSAYIPKSIIDCIEEGVTLSSLTLTVALLSLVLTLTIWLDPFMFELVRGGARIVRMRYAVMAFEKNLDLPYIDVESLDGREAQARAEIFYNARFSSGQKFIESLNEFLVSVVGVIASAALLYKINVFVILLILVSCFFEFLILRYIVKAENKLNSDKVKILNKFDYFYALSKDSEASKDIRLNNFSDYLIKSIADIIYAHDKIINKFLHLCVRTNIFEAMLGLVREFVAWVYLVYITASGKISISDFVFYFGIVTGFSNWVVRLVRSYSSIQICANDCQKFRDYVEFATDDDTKENVDFDTVEEIEFKDVSFKYPQAQNYTINNMSFKVNKGENIGIVGENGAGKTTAIKLLCGLYNATNGDILINGRSSSSFNCKSYFKLFSALFQDYYFLPMTIAQNVTASLNYDKDKLFSSFKRSGILDKINELENKENTMMDKTVYKNAVDFSGGEKQKLLLAKAIYKEAPILILDEPTAALDPIAENELYLKYNELTKDKISFFISHRLSSTRFCDRIFFISHGQIIESGTHSELMAIKGAYYRMYQIQSYYYKEQGVEVDE